MKLHRNTVWLVPLLLILSFPLWRSPVGSFLTPRGGIDHKIQTQPPGNNNFNMDSVKILQSQKGRKTALIRARSARTDETPDLLVLETVDAELFDEDGNITHIISDSGKYNIATKVLILIDDVVVSKTHDKQLLYTDLLYYDSVKRTVHCPGKTRLIGEGVRVDGGSLDYSINTSKYEIGGRVHVVLKGFSAPAGTPEPETVNQ